MVKSGKPGLKTRKVWLVQPGLHPGKPWFNQAFGARELYVQWHHSIRVKTFKWHSWKEAGIFENHFTHKFKEYVLNKLSKVSLPKYFSSSKSASEGELASVTPIPWSAVPQLEPPPPIIITDPSPAPQQWHQKPIELASCISPLQAACLKLSVIWYWPP